MSYPKKLGLEDRVKYSVKFLKNIFQITGNTPFLRGVIVGMSESKNPSLVKVKWDNESDLYTVNINNLVEENDPEARHR